MKLTMGLLSKSTVGFFRGLREDDSPHEVILVFGNTKEEADERAHRLIGALSILNTEIIKE